MRKKRFLASFLVFAMMLSLFGYAGPSEVYAASSDGSTVVDDIAKENGVPLNTFQSDAVTVTAGTEKINTVGDLFGTGENYEAAFKFDITGTTEPIDEAFVTFEVLEKQGDVTLNLVKPADGTGFSEDSAIFPDYTATNYVTQGAVTYSNQTVSIGSQTFEVTDYINSLILAGDTDVVFIVTGNVIGTGSPAFFSISSDNNATDENDAFLALNHTDPVYQACNFSRYGKFKGGDTVTFEINFDAPVEATGSPFIPVTIGEITGSAIYTGNIDANTLSFEYIMSNLAPSANPFRFGDIDLNGGTIRGTADGQSADISGFTGGEEWGIDIDNTAPSILLIERINPTPAAINSFIEDNIQYRVTFSEPVTNVTADDFTVTATSTAAVTISGIWGNGTDIIMVTGNGLTGAGDLKLDYLVASGDITDLAGNPVSGDFITGEAYVVTDITPYPVVTEVLVPAAGTYGPGNTLTFSAIYSEPVTVTVGTDAPSMTVHIEKDLGKAVYVSGSGSNTLVFAYTIEYGVESDIDGIVVDPILNIGDSTMKGADTDDADTTLYIINDTTGILIDTAQPGIMSSQITANEYITIQFSKGVWGVGHAVLQPSDFSLIFTQNGGTATGATISLITKATGAPLTGGESAVRVYFTLEGASNSGGEGVTINPAAENLIFDQYGIPMDPGHTTGELQLSPPDLEAPVPGNSGTITKSSSPTAVSVALAWTAASDNVIADDLIQYQVVRSTSNNISTTSTAIANGTIVKAWTANKTTCSAIGLSANTQYYFNVLARDEVGNVSVYTPIAITTAAVVVDSGGSGGSGGNATPQAPPTLPASTATNVGGNATTGTNASGQTQTTVVVDPSKLTQALAKENPVVQISLTGNSEVGVGVLTGEMVRQMENRAAVIEVRAGGASYVLPTSQIGITNMQGQLNAPSLQDVRVNIEISAPPQSTITLMQNFALGAGSSIIGRPVDFEVTCEYAGHEIPVNRFNGYVERTIAIPSGVDPSKITTGIVLNLDGTFSHVPTTITTVDGKYYAKINSLTNSTYAVIYNEVEFKDVANHWAKKAVNDMGSRMVLNGDASGNFAPDRDITRAEFAAIIVRALGVTPKSGANAFTDVSDKDWFNGYVNTAVSYGIITGYDADTFGSNDKITREQAMTMISRAIAIADKKLTATDTEKAALLGGYADNSGVASYAKDGVASCIKAGVISGRTSDTIAPKSNITRAEVAVAIQRMLEKTKLI